MAGRRLQGGVATVVGNLMLSDRKRAQAREDFERRYQLALSAHTTAARTHLGGGLLKQGLSPSAVMQFIQSGQLPAGEPPRHAGLADFPAAVQGLMRSGVDWSYEHVLPGGGKFKASSKQGKQEGLSSLAKNIQTMDLRNRLATEDASATYRKKYPPPTAGFGGFTEGAPSGLGRFLGQQQRPAMEPVPREDTAALHQLLQQELARSGIGLAGGADTSRTLPDATGVAPATSQGIAPPSRPGGVLHKDRFGTLAYLYPDGSVEEVGRP